VSFKFKLEALRRYRSFQEDVLQKELAQVQRNRDLEIGRLQSLMDKRTQAENDLKRWQESSTNGPRMALFDAYIQRVTGSIAEQRMRVKQADAVCNEKMQALLEAMQNRKTIDRLKEKDLQAYMENLSRNEQKFLNEIAINQFTRNSI
jgi:flagellar FliJ protein